MSLSSQRSLDCGDHNADGDVGHETVVNPIAGETDDQDDILHGPNSVPYERALGPIGHGRGSY